MQLRCIEHALNEKQSVKKAKSKKKKINKNKLSNELYAV